MNKKISIFTDLESWKHSHQLALKIYAITKGFPKEEAYGLVSQIRRCSVSVPSNIAEGFAMRTKKEKLRYYYISKGSLFELQAQLIISKDLGYITTLDFNDLFSRSKEVNAILMGLILGAKDK